MKIIKTDIEGLIIIEPKIFQDDRGYFFESFNLEKFNKIVPNVEFIQDNESSSVYGIIRGLHFQKPPFDQAKLVRCINGSVLDVAVDLRKKIIKMEKTIICKWAISGLTVGREYIVLGIEDCGGTLYRIIDDFGESKRYSEQFFKDK